MRPPGSICIDFTRTRTRDHDHLTDYAAVVDWAESTSVVTRAAARRLQRRARAHPGEAAQAHAAAVELRGDLYEILAAKSLGRVCEPKHLARLNAAIREAAAHRGLVERPEGHEWSWSDENSAHLEGLLWPIAMEAAELLTSEWGGRLGICADDTCAWLYIDESRNRSRRWCDMSDCGTRAKVRRFRERARKR